ncbi:MAG TPA: FAD/NAD(P)-binding protein [Gemmatales bacterium]|nr:FAD/NAD(P)-binding protein [Gemmatales bacterium]HMP58907.1 FAD/NAD(P)-binding protein [Gemmatales bacterium]
MTAPPTSPATPVWSQPLAPTVVAVRQRRVETADTFTLVLDPPRPGFAFQPGQFNILYTFGVGEVPISFSGDAEDASQIVHTIRAVGSVTHALARLEPGARLGVRGPYGTAWPMAELLGRDVLLITGGLGNAPLRPVALHILKHRQRYGQFTWLHGARSPSNLVFAAEYDEWQQRPDAEVLLTVDQAEPGWTGHVGLVTSLLQNVRIDPARTVALLCGPEIMMRFTQRELARRGVPEQQVYVSLERNMQCAVALCGHCQLGPSFVCLNGAVYRFDQIRAHLLTPEA